MLKKNKLSYLCLLTSILLPISPTNAHDFWLEPVSYFPLKDKILSINVLLGEHFEGTALPNMPVSYQMFQYTTANGLNEMQKQRGRIPAGLINVSSNGTHVINYQSLYNKIILNGKQFTFYLKDEGLDKIIQLRNKLNINDREASEQFSRCAKTIYRVGNQDGVDFSQKNFNCTLEIIPLKNPYSLKIGDTLSLKVLMNNKPLADALVKAYTKKAPKRIQKIQTDKNGELNVKINSPGVWMIKTLNMIPHINNKEYDWESFWSTLTFRIK